MTSQAAWFSVRCLFLLDPEKPATYEERVTVWKASSFDDAIALAEHLRARYRQRKLVLMAHSWGTVVAMHAALQLLDLFHAYVGIGQVIGDVLVVACLVKGRTAILVMTINPDGSLAGRWSRRMDRGQKGTETWKRA